MKTNKRKRIKTIIYKLLVIFYNTLKEIKGTIN